MFIGYFWGLSANFATQGETHYLTALPINKAKLLGTDENTEMRTISNRQSLPSMRKGSACPLHTG